MQHRRLVYSSLDRPGSRDNHSRTSQSKIKGEWKNYGQHMEGVVKAYLPNPKQLSIDHMKRLLKMADKQSYFNVHFNKRLHEEIEKRAEEGRDGNVKQRSCITTRDLNQAQESGTRNEQTSAMDHKKYGTLYRNQEPGATASGEKMGSTKWTSSAKISKDKQAQTMHKTVYLLSQQRNKEIEKIYRTSCHKLYRSSKKSKRYSQDWQLKHEPDAAKQGQKQTKASVKKLQAYVLNEKDSLIGKILDRLGWKPLSIISQRYTLKWSYKQESKQYSILQAANKQGRQKYYNHIKGNKLVNKLQFEQLVRNLRSKRIDVDSFVPETYDIRAQGQKFRQAYQKYNRDGRKLWVVKPALGSKGFGVEVIDRPDRVSELAAGQLPNKIVQKYIDNVWLLTPSMIQEGRLKPEYSVYACKKFDIRQWVLINPPEYYIFTHFYLRFCSRPYPGAPISDTLAHVSNYSLNRDYFHDGSHSIMSQQQFQAILASINQQAHFLKIRQQIQSKITHLLHEASLHWEHIGGCFEVVGFDILLDCSLDAWVLECNMSPACHGRALWLDHMKQVMSEDTLRVVLGEGQPGEEGMGWVRLQVTEQRPRVKEIRGVTMKSGGGRRVLGRKGMGEQHQAEGNKD